MAKKKTSFRFSDLKKPQYRPLLRIFGILLAIDLIALIVLIGGNRKKRSEEPDYETSVSESSSVIFVDKPSTAPASNYTPKTAGTTALTLLSTTTDLSRTTVQHYTERVNSPGIGFTAWYETPPEVFTPLINELRGNVSKEMLARNDEIMDQYFEAEGVFVCDENWNVLYAKNEHRQLWPGSMTKLMTAMVVLDHVEDMSQYMVVDDLYGCYEEGAALMGISEGDRITYDTLMRFMLLGSYNDTATAFALEVGGTLDHFVEMMNEKAQELGMYESHFVSPHGLFDYDHYTTAYDITIMMKAALSYPLIQEIILEENEWLGYENSEGEHVTRIEENINNFALGVYHIDGFEYLGGKTGYTRIARSGVLSVWKHGDTTLYCSVLRALDASWQTILMMDYFFNPELVEDFSQTEPFKKAFQIENEGLE